MKKFDRKQWAAFFVMACTAVLLITGLVFALYRKPIESAEVAAWVQAFASVGAILAAIYVMNTQHRRQEENSAKHVQDEQANLVLAALLYGVEVSVTCRVVRDTVGTSDKMPAPLLTFIAERMTATATNMDALPIWKMAACDALEFARAQTACKNVVASFRTTAAVEERAPTAQAWGSNLQFVTAVGIVNTAMASFADAEVAIKYLRERYRALTGTDAPGFPAGR